MYFSHIEKGRTREYAIFIVECWSGNTSIKSYYHFFKAKVKLTDTVDLDQIKELMAENIALTEIIHERDKLIDDLSLKLGE